MSNDTDITNPDIKKFKTSDIALAATLMLFKQELLGVEPITKSGNKRSDIFHFVFRDSDIRPDLVIKYTSNDEDIKVIPGPFRSTLRFLKEATKNYKDNN